jgi:hypothetical protein
MQSPTEYKPYNGLISLQNEVEPIDTGFNWYGHSRFMAERFIIVDKMKNKVPFVQQPAQLDFLYHMSLYYQIIILKARKMGFSSTALGVAAKKFLLGRNENCVSMSFDADAATKQLTRAKQYVGSYEMITGTKINFKYNRQNAMVLEGHDPETGETWQNTLRVGTAKSTSFGRGDDITYLHLTEVSFCDDVPTMLAGVGEACLPNTHKIMETTANGFNSYKKFYDDAKRLENDYAALFYSPLWEYSEEFIAKKRRDLGRLGAQEFPMTDMEAFLTSGDTYFDNISMQKYHERVREVALV